MAWLRASLSAAPGVCCGRLVCEVRRTLHSYGDDESHENEAEEDQGGEAKGETARGSDRGKAEAKTSEIGRGETR